MKNLKLILLPFYIFVVSLIPLLVYGQAHISNEDTLYYEMINFSKGDQQFTRNVDLKGDFHDETYINSLIDEKYNEIKEQMKEQNILVKEIKYANISCDDNNKCEINIVVGAEEIKK